MNENSELNLDELDITGIVKDLLKNIWVILMAGASAWLLVTAGLKMTWQPAYSSTATFAIMARGSADSTFASLNTAAAMADVLSEIFQSDILREKIAQDLSTDDFEGRISSEVIKETNLLKLTVTASDSKSAYLGIRSVINNYSSVSDYIMGNAVLEVISQPQVPAAPANPLSIGRKQKMAAFGGAAAAALCIAVMSFMRNTVKNKRSAVRKLDGRYLGTAPHEIKNRTLKSRIHQYNKSVLLTNPICSLQFSESVEKLAARVEYHMCKHRQKVLMVTSIAENEGKTTVAANMAIALAEKGYRVLIVDMDLRKPAVYKIFQQDITKDAGLGKALNEPEQLEDILKFDKKNQIYLLLNRNSYSDSQEMLSSERMQRLVQQCREKMDYVIVDTPPAVVSSDAELICALADASMLVVRQDWVDIRDINDGMDVLKQGKGEFIGYMLNNMHEQRKGGTSGGYQRTNI